MKKGNTLKEIKRIKNKLVEVSHTYIRRRDSKEPEFRIGGICCTCGKYCEGGDFQAGHYEPDLTGGALLRYHPLNMNGQGGYCCNINRHGQQKMGNAYTFFMINKHGLKVVENLRALKQKTIKADIIFYQTMLDLYLAGDEKKI